MVFSSEIFLYVFFPLVMIGHWGLSDWPNVQNVFLLLASLLFYAWGEPCAVWMMMAVIAINWAGALLLRRHWKNLVLAGTVAADVGILVSFKYLGFFTDVLNGGVGLEIPVIRARLPIGISFFIFQAISYVVDCCRGEAEPQRNALKVGLYIALFPQLVAGPIVRYPDIAAQIDHRHATFDGWADGCRRFILGLGKKVLLADRLGALADSYFGIPSNFIGILPVTGLWLGALAYTFQIFFDFSAYSDMAIGLGKMLGFRFPENFDGPYRSRSVGEFWRRWHMTLGLWFRDYVYIPLGGNRVGKWKLARNLFVVWLLTGLWHGAAWTFVVWGLCYAALIAIEKLVGERLLARMGKWGWLWTFTAVVMLWVLFRSESLGNAWSYWKGMFGAGQGSWVDINVGYQLLEYGGWLTVATALCLDWRHLLSWAKRRLPRASLAAREIGVLVVLMLVVARLANDTFRPFLYFNF